MALTNIVKRNCLGIDIGSSAIKIVELSRLGERMKLEAYGELKAEAIFQKPFRSFDKNTLLFQTTDIARAVAGIVDEAKMVSRKAVFSIPDFSTFYTTFDLPPMSLPEVPQAVRFQARQQIPVPINEVSLDWLIIQGDAGQPNSPGLKILLVAVPNEVINQYQEITRLANLELLALEAEVFGFLRSCNPDKHKIVALVDIGAQSTTCTIVEKGVLKLSRSFEPAGNEINEVLSRSLQVDATKASQIEREFGLLPQADPQNQSIREVIATILDAIVQETEKTIQSFAWNSNKLPELIILGGGVALIPGLKEYFAKKLKVEAEIANPFASVFYPPLLEKTLREMGPAYAIALGTAMRGLE